MKKIIIVLVACGLSAAVLSAAETGTPSTRMQVLAERVQTVGEGTSKEKSLGAVQAFLAPYRDEILTAARGADPASRILALYLLGLTAPDADVLRALASASREGDARVQETAMAGLAANRSNADNAEVRQALLAPIVDKRSARTYSVATLAAASLGLTEAVPVIAADLGSSDPRVKQAALSAIREYGPAARAALPALQEQLHAARDQQTATALRDVIERVERKP